MKKPWIVAPIILLTACASEESEPNAEILERFAEAGEVPDCATLDFADQAYEQSLSRYILSATYAVSEDCVIVWDERLNTAGFEIQPPNGEFLSRARPDVMVTSPAPDTRSVLIMSSEPSDNLTMRE